MRFLHESLYLTCLEEKSLYKVLWLTCFILNRLLSAAVKKLKINHLKLSIYLKKYLIEVDTLLLYTCLIFLWKKICFNYWQSRVFTFNTTLSLIYLKQQQQDCCLAPNSRIVSVSDNMLCEVERTQFDFSVICLRCIFSFIFLIEI